jgi:hypothetical protein
MLFVLSCHSIAYKLYVYGCVNDLYWNHFAIADVPIVRCYWCLSRLRKQHIFFSCKLTLCIQYSLFKKTMLFLVVKWEFESHFGHDYDCCVVSVPVYLPREIALFVHLV